MGKNDRSKEEIEVLSPNGETRFNLLMSGASLAFSVSARNASVIDPSPIAFTVDGVALTEDVSSGNVERYEVNETYPWRGVHAQAVNRCWGAKISLDHTKSGTGYTLEVRAFDDGVAFRLIVPGGDRPRVPDEATKLILPAGSTVWYHDLEGHYEGIHNKRAVADAAAGDWAAPPLTFKLTDGAGYASITEAALLNYAGMALQADGNRGFDLVLGHAHHVSYPFRLRYEEDIERLKVPAAIEGTITTPWRVVLVGPDLHTLVASDIIHNLCPPADKALFPNGLHTNWIRPGRAVWRYLDGGERTLQGMKAFSRMASDLGFEHHVIEGFWRDWSEDELRELTAYSAEQGVGIWLWKHSKDLRTPESQRAFFDTCVAVGATGAKVDFFDHEAKEVVDRYYDILREAAERRLMICFHGSNKPSGEPRTWPNELNRESIRGMEYRRTTERARHNVTLPFTRFLAGHADYTPVHFGERLADTSWMHQIASAVIFTSPLLTYAAHPQTLLDHPCADLIKSIPAVWDETVVLPVSEIGEVAAFARRHGDTWFLAVMNAPSERTLDIPLSFLGEGSYQTALARDNMDDPAAVVIENAVHKREDTLTVALRSGGGFVARFSKV